MPNILYYISGHGYGHATRSIELIKALMLKSPNLYFHIKTDAPEWIFNLNLKENYSLDRIKIDVGTVQNTSFYIDKKETLNEWDDLLNKKDAIAEEEVAYAEKLKAKIIIADIPPLAFDMARKAGIPSVALANFTWDWIYSHYTEDYPDFSCLVQQIKSSYRKADLLLRLPFYGDLSVFPKIKDIPLIARQAIKSKAEILELLNLNKNHPQKLVLVALRASDLTEVNLNRAFASNNFFFITMGLTRSYKHNLNLPPNFIRFTDLVNACDLVLSKPGYGIVSDIIANQTPLLYTQREDFAEYSVLVQGLKRYAVSNYLPQKDFFSGNWGDYLQKLLNNKKPWEYIPVNGADKGAVEILNLI